MRTHAPHTTLDPVLGEQQCSHPDCGEWYDVSDPDASYPHNNH